MEVLEKNLNDALEKAENADNEQDAKKQNKIADAIEADIEDLEKEINQVKQKAGVESRGHSSVT